MVAALATAIEFRSKESGDHVNRIYTITKRMFSETALGEGLEPSEIEEIALASILHDVGKIAVPDSILNKPGRLTAEEFEVMKTTPPKGGAAFQIPQAAPPIGTYQYAVDIRILALLGAFFALVMNKSQKRLAVAGGTREKMRELLKGITIMKQEPKVLLGGIVRVINTTAQFAFPVFLPMYMADYGFTTTEWLRIWGTIFTANIVFNLIFGFVGDKWGGATPLSGSAAWAAVSPRCCSTIRRSFRRAISGW